MFILIPPHKNKNKNGHKITTFIIKNSELNYLLLVKKICFTL